MTGTNAAVPAQAGPGREGFAATPAQVLGDMVFLAMKSPDHRGCSLAEFEALVVPAIMTKQFRLWRNDTQPIALAVWAMASEEVAARITAGERTLSPAEWRSGETFVIVDLIAPYGGREGFERALRELVGGA